ncbi:MAG TPA: hypothetical protein VGX69_06270 [Solirubrobacteraceae bacterium]|jgi:hypothetical protein|nr:hypothetical protein [Solirubrobacteraceae bacterium]
MPAITGATLLVALAVAGCGSSGATSTRAIAVTPIPFKSAALARGTIPARYTCDGKDVSPPLEWGNVPSSTKELALLVIGLGTSTNGNSITIEWAVAGVNPALHRLAAGRLPAGAHLGMTTRKTTRYSICPPAGKTELYQFSLYAVPPSITIPRAFAGIRALINLASEQATAPSRARGNFEASYKRK